MSNKELRRMGRRELLELLVQQKQNNVRLQKRVIELEQRLAERFIIINEAGTLAEASIALNGVFEAADRAAKQYLENIQHYTELQKNVFVSAEEGKPEEIPDNTEMERPQYS